MAKYREGKGHPGKRGMPFPEAPKSEPKEKPKKKAKK